MKFKKIIMSQLCLIVVFMLVISCSDSNSTSVIPQDEVPQVPSAKSIAFDVSIFDSQQQDSTAQGQANYQQASQAIEQIQFLQGRQINPVRNLFENADTADAIELKEGKWQWKYSNKEGRLNYSIRLVAIQKKANKVKWKVLITSPLLQSREILFITGTTNREVTEGTWTYNSFPRAGQPQQEFATLEWEIEEGINLHMVLKIIGSNSLQGSTATYDAEGQIRTILLDPADEPKTTIKFNAETKAGFIKTPDYNNGQKACWNSNFEDIKCSKINVD